MRPAVTVASRAVSSSRASVVAGCARKAWSANATAMSRIDASCPHIHCGPRFGGFAAIQSSSNRQKFSTCRASPSRTQARTKG